MTRTQRLTFEHYWQERVQRADAITPGEKLTLVAELERELTVEGRLPLPSGPARIPVDHPIVAAALTGRPVSVGGSVVTTTPALSERMQGLPVAAKLALLGLIGLLPIVGALLLMRSGNAEAAPLPTPTATATVASTPTPLPTTTNEVTATPLLPTATPYSISLVSGDAPDNHNDPASIEMAGHSYILATGRVQNGSWLPSGAEWLEGTLLRRVVALPFEPELVESLSEMREGAVIQLRLRSGEVVKYRVSAIERRQRQQIELLAAREPSLVIILAGEAGPERWVVIADAIQQPTLFTESAAATDTESLMPLVDATHSPTIDEARTITSTRTITNDAAGLTLTVDGCERVAMIGQQEPPTNNQAFMICDLTLAAMASNEGPVAYSGQYLAVTEASWWAELADWWPQSVSVSRALRSGTLNPGSETSGRIAGTVSEGGSSLLSRNKSEPILLWQQEGLEIQILVEAEEEVEEANE